MTKFVLIALAICISGVPVRGEALPKMTDRAALLVANDPTSVHNFWLFFDSTAKSSQPVALSARALARRAKVDPVNFLIDQRDAAIEREIIIQVLSSGMRVRHISRWFNAVSVEGTPAQLAQLANTPSISRIDLVSSLRVIDLSDPRAAERIAPPADATALQLNYGGSLTQNLLIKSVKMHNAGYTGAGVLIAMFDSGFNTDHAAFDSTSIVATRDFIQGDSDVTGTDCADDPQDRHGTVTLGAVGGYLPGTLIGTAFGADFALAKTEITCGGTEIKIEEDNWIAAAEWADSIGADIISASLGYYIFQDSGSYTMDQLDGNSARITIAADIAASKNILVCTAAGNERNDAVWPTIIFPADGDSVLAVGATRPDSLLASFSSPGPTADGRIKPDIVTMGQGVFTAASAGGFTFSSGTSLSTPLAAGGAALAFDFDSTLTAMQLLQRIKLTGDRADNPDNNYGYGLMDASRAADVLRLVVSESLHVDSGTVVEVPISTAGKTTETASLAAFDLPDGVTIVDSGNGAGSLQFDSTAQLLPLNRIGLVAGITNFKDTAFLTVSSSVSIAYPRDPLAYPNPFDQRLTIAGGSSDEPLLAVTIVTVSGEKVWERVNISPGTSDTYSIEWDGRNGSGVPVAPGVYLVLVQTSRSSGTIKVVKVR